MKEGIEPAEKSGTEFPLPRNTPLSPDEVVRGIGGFARRFKTELNGTSDFPQEVVVRRKDGAAIKTTLTSLYADSTTQADGTFYFSDRVREDPHSVNFDYLFGREIESITFLE